MWHIYRHVSDVLAKEAGRGDTDRKRSRTVVLWTRRTYSFIKASLQGGLEC